MNRLSDETSPYLLQHAENPVDWYPWCEQALAAAREQDKPILLSIGYSACHWCHVMAHESFEDAGTAAIMNAEFINIKVDREERPDLDKIYQHAHALLTNRPGGWPLTVFLAPDDQMPIFAGTYFPPAPRHGLPSFKQVLGGIADTWRNRREEVDRQSTSLREAFARLTSPGLDPETRLGPRPLDIAASQITDQFDARYGGYSSPPKFPHPAILRCALNHWSGSRSDAGRQVLHTALFTLERMNAGGIFDHLGGGFYRYSTDERWMIPHFEKMLYDNGPLLELNAAAALITGNVAFHDAATESADWVMREMQSAQGGYFSSLDADSEGEEGRFYTWTQEEIKTQLDGDDLALFTRRFALDEPSNFEGRWHLYARVAYEDLDAAFDGGPGAIRERLLALRGNLLRVREQRVHPARDDKILTAWNALMIRGMASAGRMLQRDDYIDSAERAVHFIQRHLWRDNRLLATCKDGRAHLNAYLDDYAFLLSALLELMAARWNTVWLNWARMLADRMVELFEDKDTGGYYFTSHDHEELIMRSKTFNDEAIPAGSAIAAQSLQRLGYLVAEPRYLKSAEKCLKAAWPEINQSPIAYCSMLDALHEHLQPPRQVILRGTRSAMADWLAYGQGRLMVSTHIYAIDAECELPTGLADKTASASRVRAYICEGLQCRAPLESLEAWRAFVDSIESRVLPQADTP